MRSPHENSDLFRCKPVQQCKYMSRAHVALARPAEADGRAHTPFHNMNGRTPVSFI